MASLIPWRILFQEVTVFPALCGLVARIISDRYQPHVPVCTKATVTQPPKKNLQLRDDFALLLSSAQSVTIVS